MLCRGNAMDRRIRRSGAGARRARIAAAVVLACAAVFMTLPAAGEDDAATIARLLGEIFGEVRELGPFPGETFIQRDFWIGEDDDDTNKSTHVIVLIQPVERPESMKVQVTEMESVPGNKGIRNARRTRTLRCGLGGPAPVLVSTEIPEKELKKDILPGLLKAIRDKKKLWGHAPKVRVPV